MIDARGVTLVEVTVVILVIGIAAAVATPRLPDFGPGRSAAVAAAVAVLKEARRQAARRGRTVELEVGPGGRWEIRRAGGPVDGGSERGPEPDAGTASPGRASAGRILRAGTFRVPVELSGGSTASSAFFRFGPRGRAAGPRLRVRGASGQWVTLTVKPWSGRVRAVR